MHACNFSSLTYFFFLPKVKILPVVRPAYYLTFKLIVHREPFQHVMRPLFFLKMPWQAGSASVRSVIF